jgi:micrococcal nuclease
MAYEINESLPWKYFMKRTSLSFVIPFLILTILISLSHAETFTVKRVIDGDTLEINYKGKEESVRLIGIDAPESRPNKKARNDAQRSGEDLKTITAMGKEATEYVRSLVKQGDTLKMEFDVQKRDKYGRLLGYVYLSNGKMLNEEIVKAGYANLMTIPPNVKYQERFLKAYKEAREHGRGLWK